MKKAIQLLLALSLLFASCKTTKPVQQVRNFIVTEVGDSTFTAKSGRLKATFPKISCDSVYVGKTIKAGRAIFIK